MISPWANHIAAHNLASRQTPIRTHLVGAWKLPNMLTLDPTLATSARSTHAFIREELMITFPISVYDHFLAAAARGLSIIISTRWTVQFTTAAKSGVISLQAEHNLGSDDVVALLRLDPTFLIRAAAAARSRSAVQAYYRIFRRLVTCCNISTTSNLPRKVVLLDHDVR